LAPEGSDALLEHALVLLEAQDLGAQPPELAAQGVDVGDVVLDLGGGAAQGGRPPPDRDLLVGRPVFLPSRPGITGPLDPRANLVPFLERDRPRHDLPLVELTLGSDTT